MAQPRASKQRPISPPHWTETLPTWAWLLLFAAWTLLLYSRVLQAPFVYDDLQQVVRDNNLSTWHTVFSRFVAAPVAFTSELRTARGGSFYRPIYWLSLALDRQLWGLHSEGFHLTSLGLHLSNGTLLFLLLRRLRFTAIAAAAVALLWLGLPINSEAVAWISARAYLLCFFFVQFTLLASLRFTENRRPIYLGAAFFAALAALLSHESGVLILPFAALMLFLYSDDGILAFKRRSSILLFAAYLTAIALFFTIRISLGVHGAVGTPAPFAFALALWKYIGWTLLPVHMSVERSTSAPPNVLSPVAGLAWVGLAALIALIILLRRRNPGTAFGLAWLVVAFAPFCGLVFLYQGMAERFAYIASIGASIAIVSAITSARPPVRNIVLAIAALWAVWSIVRLEMRLADWNSPETLFRSSLEATPESPTLYFNLGFTLREENQLAEAASAYQSAIHLNPGYQRAYSSLGETYARMGQLEKAQGAYQQALVLDPHDAGTTLNLAVLLNQAGKHEDAERTFRHAIALDPNDSAAYTDLGVLLYQQGHPDEAAKMFQSAIDRRSTDPTPYFNLAILYQQSGHPDLALALYRKVLELRPDDPDTLANIQRLQNQR
jgi:tetratricopeptide (TPR) repeat protein